MNLLPKKYFPKHDENRMKEEGNLENARKRFYNEKPTNLVFLLKKRYLWMNKYLKNKKNIYELGCGAGFSKVFLKNKNLILSDLSDYEWVDKKIDALNLPFKNNSIDVFICSHMIHHLANPYNFLNKAINCLKPGGLILISEVHTSFFLKILLRLMRHEGWSYDIDVFSSKSICNDPSDLWSANCAIPEILFADKNKFEMKIKNTKIIHKKLKEFLIFPISGGVIAKTKTINLPYWFLKIIHVLDVVLTRIFPNIFALGMEVVVQKSK